MTPVQEFIATLKELRNCILDIPKKLSALSSALNEHAKAIHEARQSYENAQRSAPILRADLQVPHPIEVQTDSKEKHTTRENLKFFVSTLTLLFVGVYTVVTVFIFCETKRSADATTRAANSEVAANRAWIVPDFPPQHKRVIEEANLEWHNAGKTPAISVFSWKEYFPGEFPKRMNSCAEAESAVKKQPLDSLQYQGFIAEGGRYEIGLDHAPAWVGQQPIFIHGCIWYTDISSNTEKSSEFFYVAFQNKFGLPNSEGVSLFFDRPFTYK
jgi:hypothetical protein